MLLGHLGRERAGLQWDGCGSDFWKDILRSYAICETKDKEKGAWLPPPADSRAGLGQTRQSWRKGGRISSNQADCC